jgi:hypothetical protein
MLGSGELMRGEGGGELDRGLDAGCELPCGEPIPRGDSPLPTGGAVRETGAVWTGAVWTRWVAVPRS